MATTEQINQLRLLLGEVIPTGGDDSDSLFTDAQITNWVDSTNDLDRAAYEGWKAKAAQFANRVF